jgi:uncharacterized protein YdiU (UPF0061 family)
MTNKKDVRKTDVEYSYYSKVLKKPFDTVEALKEAEAAYYTQVKEKLNKTATKKADAAKVEDAFKSLNLARKTYKENILKLTSMYQEDLKKLKANFEADKDRIHSALADAETVYDEALKQFNDKYPEGYHITLKDGDFESTIVKRSSNTAGVKDSTRLYDLFDLFFRF